METVNQAPLFDPKSAQYVLGCLMHQPNILYDEDKYRLLVEDFCGKVYVILFGAIYNLSFSGAERITPPNINLYLSSFQTQYDDFMNSNGQTLVDLIYQMTDEFDIAQFNIYYDRVKKFSTLRELDKKGFDIKEFYNPNFLNQEEEENRFNKLTVQDILNKIRNKIQLVENHNTTKQNSTGQYAAKGVRDLVQNLKTMPEVGIPMEGEIINYATRGCRKGKMYLYSGPSGGGKTRTMIGNACSIAFPKIENGKVVKRDTLEPVLFIATEMNADEIQTLILSWISGVDEEKILIGSYTEDEEDLVSIAINIMEKYEKNFIIESIPNPCIQSLKSMITNYIIHDSVEYIYYDYIFSSPGLISEFQSINLREDVVLMMLSNTLKEVAASYNIFMMSGTQLNGDWEKKTIRNANMIRGSKAIADKIDVGMIGVRCPEEELNAIKDYCASLNLPLPNIVVDIYKNRRGKMCDVKIFRKFNYGTCRCKDIVVTTTSYKPIDDIVKFNYDVEYEDIKDYRGN